MNASLDQLKQEKEESAAKTSELEVEILELKETQELLEDERERISTRCKAAEQELTQVSDAKERAVDQLKAMEIEYSAQTEAAENHHHEAIDVISKERDGLIVTLGALKEELAAAFAAHEQAKLDAQTRLDEHVQKLQEVEQSHKDQQAKLSDEVARITAELQVINTPLVLLQR